MIQCTRRSSFNIFIAGVIFLMALFGGVIGTAPRAQALTLHAEVPVPPPVLTNVSDSATPDRFSVAGRGFTPDGTVYLAIYDQMGLKLYEHRTVSASSLISAYNAWVFSTSTNNSTVPTDGGRIRETFAGLCGASALIRAFDVVEEQWSNWLTIQPECPDRPGSVVANDLNASPRFPVASPDLTAAETANDLYARPAGQGTVVVGGPTVLSVVTSHQSPGSVTVRGQGFTPGDRVYLAIYDQRGAVLYPTRWVTSTPTGFISGFDADSPEGHPVNAAKPDGIILESFANLCGANVMVRAYDLGTSTWSNWVSISVGC